MVEAEDLPGTAQAASRGPMGAHEALDASPKTTGAPVVLIVDDDPETRELLLRVMSAAGYTAAAADSGHAATEVVRRLRPAAAVVDLMLPDMSGLELIHDWRTNWWLGMQEVPVVVLSGRSEDEDCAAAEVLGVERYLVKPVEPENIAEHMVRILSEPRTQAFHSPLTGLPGATALQEEIRRRRRRGEPWAMLTINITGLNALNGKFGYKKGDQAIRMLAAVISAGRQSQGRIFHTSGASFVEILDPESVEAEADAAFQGFRLFQTWLDDSTGGIRLSPISEGEDRSSDAVHLGLAAVGVVVMGNLRVPEEDRLAELTTELMREAKRRPGTLVKRVLE